MASYEDKVKPNRLPDFYATNRKDWEVKRILTTYLDRWPTETFNEDAKGNLIRFREEIRALEREKGRIVATLANAKARRRMAEALDGLSVDADMRALENVREHVARLATEVETAVQLSQKAAAAAGPDAELLRLSARGRRLYRRIVPKALAWEQSLVATLSAAEQRTLFKLLDKLDDRGIDVKG